MNAMERLKVAIGIAEQFAATAKQDEQGCTTWIDAVGRLGRELHESTEFFMPALADTKDNAMNTPILYVPGPLVRCARAIAIEAHTACNQRYGDLPYVTHLADVAANAIAFAPLLHLSDDRDVAVASAWLHDVLEDTHTTYNDLKQALTDQGFGVSAEEVCENVYALTNDKGRTRSERAGEAYYAGIRSRPVALFVKLCDRLANLQNGGDMLAKYRAEHRSFADRLNTIATRDADETFIDFGPLWQQLERELGGA